jgi:LuxR family transcriptional regulator, maltose regulon positive regulatory protein
MPAPLLRTKFYIPPPQPRLVARPRLLDKLAGAFRPGVRLVLISAPAGYGKTTLLSDWIADLQRSASPVQFCWLSLDAEDNDLYRFWRYLIAALQTVNPSVGIDLMEQLASSPPPPIPQLLVMLINDLAALPAPLALVLDDFHVIENKAVQESLAYLLEHLPEKVYLVLSARADPFLPLHRLRGRGQMIELRTADLRFTSEEAAAFMNQRLDVTLGQKEAGVLEARIEGWVTGLQMAALSMQGRQDWRAFLDNFRGSHHYILEYLTEEVISRQPPAVQAFLMQTAILDRFCAPLCDSVVQAGEDQAGGSTLKSSDQILAYLETSNLFLVPLDQERQWFRYHHLFSDLLQARLRSLNPGIEVRLYLRASEWFERSELGPEAIRYAIRGKHYERAADLLERSNLEMWARSSVIQMRMVHDIPYEVIRERPWLMLGLLWTFVITGQYGKVMSTLNDLEQIVQMRPELPGVSLISGFTAAVRAYIAELQGKPADLEALYANAMKVLHMDRTGIGNSAGFMLGYVLYINGKFDDADRVLFDSVKTDLESSTTNALPISMSRAGRLRLARGRLHAAADLYRQNLEEIDQRGAWRFYLSGLMNLGLAEVLREWNDLEAAEAQARTGDERNNAWGIPHAIASGCALLARIHLAQGNATLALQTLEAGEKRVGQATILPDARSEIDSAWVRAWLALGDVRSAERLCAKKGVHPQGNLSFRQELDYLSLARVMLAQQGWETAHSLLIRMAAAAVDGGRSGRLTEILVLDALCLFSLERGSFTRALEVLHRALVLGEPEGYARVFLDEGEPLAKLLRLGCQSGQWRSAPLQAYVDRLLAGFSVTAPVSAAPGAQGPQGTLVEPLSEREVEVLSLLAEGLSNREIGERLYISTGTVKAHAHSIYGKLDVNNRTQAIARARQLGVIA